MDYVIYGIIDMASPLQRPVTMLAMSCRLSMDSDQIKRVNNGYSFLTLWDFCINYYLRGFSRQLLPEGMNEVVLCWSSLHPYSISTVPRNNLKPYKCGAPLIPITTHVLQKHITIVTVRT